MAFKENDPFNKTKNVSPEQESLLQWQKAITDMTIESDPRGKTYYKDLNFKSIKDFFYILSQYYNSMRKLLNVKAENETEYKEIIKMRYALFKRIEQTVNHLAFDWTEATGNFSGSSEQRQEAYEAIIDEIKSAISGCDPPTDKDELEMFMKHFKHFVNWLMSEALNYSLGERVDSTDPQRYGLEDSYVKASAGAEAMSRGRYMDEKSLRKGKGVTFRKKGQTEPSISAGGDKE
jgi:hypothetical protein